MLASGPALAAGEYAPACGGLKPPGGYPTFCSIPKTPTDVRAPAEFKDAEKEALKKSKNGDSDSD